MSKISDLIIKVEENGKKATLPRYPEGKAENAEPKHPSSTWSEYWGLCLTVVYAAGDIASHDKLLMNYRDKAKAHSVEHVVNNKKYYPDGVRSVKASREACVLRFFKAVDEINWYAREHDLDQASAMKLMGFLESGKDREKFKRHIKRHMENNEPPFELDELPLRDFRKPR